VPELNGRMVDRLVSSVIEGCCNETSPSPHAHYIIDGSSTRGQHEGSFRRGI